MEYYIRELLSEQKAKDREKHAGGKARNDVSVLLEQEGMQPLDIYVRDEERESGNLLTKLWFHISSLLIWLKQTWKLKRGDALYVQFPVLDHFIFQGLLFAVLRLKRVQIHLIVHDLTILREVQRTDKKPKERLRMWLEEKLSILLCSRMIVHNVRMAQYLQSMHINREKMVNLRLFDYLIPDWDDGKAAKRQIGPEQPVIVAGNLSPSKAGYVYQLPEDCRFRLYGVLYEGKESANTEYMGAFLPEELPYEMNGSFGLVWDGESAGTCSGIYGNYLRINNPHKTSLYLASGIPVIIWEEAALADFVKRQNVGRTISSLDELQQAVGSVTEEEYEEMLVNVRRISSRLRNGYFMKRAVALCRKDVRS